MSHSKANEQIYFQQIMKKFHSQNHRKEIKKLERLWKNLSKLSAMAKEYGILDIFQDNGAKVLQQLVYLNMDILPGREGNDCISASKTEWEMKSANEALGVTGFSTNHHTNLDIIAKYRKVPWTFSIYSGIELVEIYVLLPEQLEPLFKKWEEQLKEQAKFKEKPHLNNPKIHIKFVREYGTKVFPYGEKPIDPDSLLLK